MGIVPSVEGAYCQCEWCGHIWLATGLRLTRHPGGVDSPRRRKSDRQAPHNGGGVDAQETEGEDHHAAPPLEQLKQRIVDLEVDNALLRDSARTFADLAERLNAELRRRRFGDRRKNASATPGDRRKQH